MELLFVLGLVLIPFFAFLPNKVKPYHKLLINIIWAVPTSLWAVEVFSTQTPLTIFIGDFPVTGLWEFKVDLLGAYFLLIVNLITLCSSVYSIAYMSSNTDGAALSMKFVASSLLHLGMLCVCMIQTFIPFLIVWEIMSLSSFVLVIFQFKKELTLKAGLNYLVQMHIGVLFIMVAMTIVNLKTGGTNFESLSEYFSIGDSNFWMFLLFFVGFGFKVGFIPLHTWMPDAYTAAPSQVSAVMSGVMKKMGLLGILRVMLHVQSSRLEIGLFILSISLITCLYGGINAIMQKDIKRLLSYSSIENMGVIGVGLGMGMVGFGVHDLALAFMGFMGALLQILNHALIKSSLFLSNGALYQQTGTRNIEKLGGMAKLMPTTAIIFMLASVAICALPPFSAFSSKYIIYSGLLEGMNATFVTTEVFLMVCLLILSLVGGLAIYAYTKLFGLVFLGNPRSKHAEDAQETNWGMWMPQLFLMLISLSIGLFPALYFNQVSKIIGLFVPNHDRLMLETFNSIEGLGYMSLIFILIAGVVFGLRYLATRGRVIEYGPTWGCGYAAKNPRMQYTSSSWADYFVKFGGLFTGSSNSFTPIMKDDIFPTNKKMKIDYYDKIDRNFIQRGLEGIDYLLKKLAVIQTGQTQFYILYAFIFLIIMGVVTAFNII